MTAIKQLLTKVESLNGAQRRLGRYLQNDSSALLLSNVNDLAQAVGVSKATVVRFAKTLGYAGFPEFKRDIQKEMRRKLRAADRMKETFAELGDDENIFAVLHRRQHRRRSEIEIGPRLFTTVCRARTTSEHVAGGHLFRPLHRTAVDIEGHD